MPGHCLVRAGRGLLLALALAGPGARAAEPAAPSAPTAPPASLPGLPAPVARALGHAGLPAQALALWVQPADGGEPLAAWNAELPMNPASVFKLVTTAAALDELGPAFTWHTPVAFTGPVRRGVLHGSLVVRGSGDPSLVLERVWLLLRQVRALGVREIDGDIVLDHGAFAPDGQSPGDFDGTPSEPYNVRPDALLLNYKAVTLQFTPDAAAHVARVVPEPALQGLDVDEQVRLAGGPCGDWRTQLRLSVEDGRRWHAAGAYPAACGERRWPLAYPEPARYDERLVAALWQEMGGRLRGTVHPGQTPDGAETAFEFESPPLAAVVRDMNKFSNNVMAEQIALTLALNRRAAPAEAAREAGGTAGVTAAEARAALVAWLHERLGAAGDAVTVVNGSGLSRESRISAHALGMLLGWAWRSPVMPELVASLPVVGVDGTLRHAGAGAGRAHLKSGSMRDVAALAGYVLGADGRRYVLVALVNGSQAGAAHPVLDAAVDWVEQAGAR